MSKKADVEISTRTILMLILFLVVTVVIIILGVMFGAFGNQTVSNMTKIAEVFCVGDKCI
jgi:hypothetical protein